MPKHKGRPVTVSAPQKGRSKSKGKFPRRAARRRPLRPRRLTQVDGGRELSL